MSKLEDWAQTNEVSVKDLDSAVGVVRELKNKHQESKAISDAHYAALKEAEDKLVSLLQYAGKTTYIAEGLGRATLKKNLSVKVPKTPEQKKVFFDWVKEHMGEDAYYAYMTVNSQSLNSMYKTQAEEYGNRGEILNIDGLEDPTEYTTLSFTKA